MTFLEAAGRVLAEAGSPLHYVELTKRALERGYLESAGKTPEQTMSAALGSAAKKAGAAADIVKVGRGVWALAKWGRVAPLKPRKGACPKPLTPIDKILQAIEAQRSQVKQELLSHLLATDPSEFEELVGALLDRMNFRNIKVTQRSKDGGLDLLADFAIGITDVRTIAEVKRVRSSVGVDPVKKLYATMMTYQGTVHLGLFITTSRFSRTAMAWVKDSNVPIALIDGAKLAELFAGSGLMVEQEPIPAPLRLAVQPPPPPPPPGMLPEGLRIVGSVRGERYEAQVGPEGKIIYGGNTYGSPSAAGRAATAWRSCDGWHFWKYEAEDGNWRDIDDFREGTARPAEVTGGE